MGKRVPVSKNIQLKKKFGQHFLRDKKIAQEAVHKVSTDGASVFEIGCGDGFLTQEILKTDCQRLWIFEIDPEWATLVKDRFRDDARVTVFQENILDADFSSFEQHKPWTLIANLPYQITFPILHMLHRNRHLIAEGVIMIQEEVAQKIVKTSGRGYGYQSLFLQHHFDFQLMSKVPASAFYPPPKVVSRLIYFKPKQTVAQIPDEQNFWKFIKICFRQPRRTLRNNLNQAHFDTTVISDAILGKRAQQLFMEDFLELWNQVRT